MSDVKDFVVVLCGGPADGEVREADGGESIAWVTEDINGMRQVHRYDWGWFSDSDGPPWLCNAVWSGASEKYGVRFTNL